MAEQIRIDADVSGVLGAVNKLKTAAEGLNKTLGSTDVNVRTDQAQKSLSSLTATAEATRKALEAAGGAFDIDASEQAQAVDELKTALDEVAKLAADGIDLQLDTSKAREQIDALRREMGKRKPGAQASGAVAPASAAPGASAQGAAAGEAALSAERRRALREEREERNRLRRIGAGRGRTDGGGAPAPNAGAPGGGSGSPPGADTGRPQNGPESFFARLGKQLRSDPQTGRLGRITGAAGGIAGGLMSGNGSGGMMRSIGGGMGTLGGAAIGTLIGGPLGAVVGGLAGSLLGSVGGSAGGKMDEAVGDVMTEGLDLANLQRSIGGTNTGLGELQTRLREASTGLQTTFVEMAKYGQQFARQANYRGNASELAEEVKNAVGYARGFGADPQAGLQFSASMRHTQASRSDQDSRKIGLSVAEAIGRGGLGPKTDEVLSAIGNFANQATNQSLTAADVSSFASALGTASATGIAGLAGNPGNAASLIGQADAAMRQGGAFGQASSVLTDIALRKQGMNFGDVNLLKEQGLFGTEKDAFGAESAVQKSLRTKIADTTGSVSDSEKAQMRTELARYEGLAANGDGRTNADKVMGRLREMSANQTEYRESLKSHFGLKTASQAEAFDAVMRTHGGTGALSKRLEAAGVDTRNLNALSVGGMSEAFAADRTGLQRMGGDILKDKEFSSKHSDVADKLRAALGGKDTEALRNAIFQAKEKGAGNMTEIERANQASIDLKNEFMKYAQAILPAVTAAKDGILALVEKLAPDSDFDKQAKAEREIVSKAASGDPEERKRQAARAAEMVAEGKMPITREVAKLAREGAGGVSDKLDKDASEFEALAQKAKKSWFLPGDRSRSLEEWARKLRKKQANLKGGTFNSSTSAGDIAVPEGATAGQAPAAPAASAASAAPATQVASPMAAVPAPAAAGNGRIRAKSNGRTVDFATDMPKIDGLSGDQTRTLLANVASTESSAKHDTSEQNYAGFLGRYQFGAEALIGAGLIDKKKHDAAKASAKKEGRPWWGSRFKSQGSAHADFLNDPSSWTSPGLRDKYVSSPDLQDEVMVRHTNANLAYAKKRGAISANSDAKKIGGAAKAMHIAGIGAGTNYILGGADKKDGLGTATSKYYNQGASAVAATVPAVAVAAAIPAAVQADMQPIPVGGKDGPGAAVPTAGGASGGQQTVKVISEIVVRDSNGKERDDVQARPLSYESLPAGVPA